MTYNIAFMFEIFHLQGNACLKASLAVMYLTAFILRSSNFEWEENESVVEFIFSIGETFHTHRYTHAHIFVAFLETGNKNSH